MLRPKGFAAAGGLRAQHAAPLRIASARGFVAVGGLRVQHAAPLRIGGLGGQFVTTLLDHAMVGLFLRFFVLFLFLTK